MEFSLPFTSHAAVTGALADRRLAAIFRKGEEKIVVCLRAAHPVCGRKAL
jgi:hypothetical protein